MPGRETKTQPTGAKNRRRASRKVEWRDRYVLEGLTSRHHADVLAIYPGALSDKPRLGFSGDGLCIHKYRITVELVPEPDEVLAARVRELWETTKFNHHYADVFTRAAKRYGIVLDHSTRGCRVKP